MPRKPNVTPLTREQQETVVRNLDLVNKVLFRFKRTNLLRWFGGYAEMQSLGQYHLVRIVRTCKATEPEEIRRYIFVSLRRKYWEEIWRGHQWVAVQRDFREILFPNRVVLALDDKLLRLAEGRPSRSTLSFFRQDLHKALGKLTLQQRHILRRRFWEGKTFQEIGDELGMSRTAAANVGSRSLRELAEYLGEDYCG